jgi:hypothetical protein
VPLNSLFEENRKSEIEHYKLPETNDVIDWTLSHTTGRPAARTRSMHRSMQADVGAPEKTCFKSELQYSLRVSLTELNRTLKKITCSSFIMLNSFERCCSQSALSGRRFEQTSSVLSFVFARFPREFLCRTQKNLQWRSRLKSIQANEGFYSVARTLKSTSISSASTWMNDHQEKPGVAYRVRPSVSTLNCDQPQLMS